MSENNSQTPNENAAAQGAPEKPVAPDILDVNAVAMDPQEVEKGKTFAILSYIFILWIIPIIQKDNEFSLFHAKQAITLFLAQIALGIVSGILTLLCIGPIVWSIGGIALFVLWIIGLLNAVKGVAKPLPLIGKLAAKWFKGIQKKA